MGAILRKYNTATTILFPLVERDAVDFADGPPTFAAGDVKISKDEGAFANIGTLPTHEGNGIFSLALTATELQAARIVVTIRDQTATKVWEDQAVLIETYGHASAQHAFDLDAAEVQADVAKWRGTQPNTLQSGRVDGYVGALAAAVVTAAGTASDFLEAVADKVLDRPISNVEPGTVFRTLYGAIASLVNRRRILSGNVEIFQTDDSTKIATIPISTNPNQEPITELDPP